MSGKQVLVLCPTEFRSYSKLCRKLDFLLQNLSDVSLCAPLGQDDMLDQYVAERSLMLQRVELDAVLAQAGDITISHAVVFDDGEVFPEVLAVLRELPLSIRRVKIAITRVVNIKRDERFAGQKSTDQFEYIGRGSYWGNPYAMFEDGDDRDEVIRKFKYDFDYEKFTNKDKSEVYKLAGKHLGCFCKPQACHGDVLAEFLNAWDDGE